MHSYAAIPDTPSRGPSVGISVLLHATIIAAAVFGALLFKQTRQEHVRDIFDVIPVPSPDTSQGNPSDARSDAKAWFPAPAKTAPPVATDTPAQPTDNRITASEFFKKNPHPDLAKPTQQSRPPPTNTDATRHVAPTQIRLNPLADNAVPNDSRATSAEQDQMARYLASLVQRIKDAHEKPDGVSNELVARVEYQVSAAAASAR